MVKTIRRLARDIRVKPLYDALDQMQGEAVKLGAETVIEMGGSTGYRFVRTLHPGLAPVGFVEIDPEKLGKAQWNLSDAGIEGVTFYQGDVTNLRGVVPDNAADVVRANDLLEHLDDAQITQALSEFRRIGRFLIAFSPNRFFKLTTYATAAFDWNYPHREEILARGGLDLDHKQDFTGKSFIQTIEDNGYDVRKTRLWVGFGWTGVLAERRQ